jgi:hypothetical protein
MCRLCFQACRWKISIIHLNIHNIVSNKADVFRISNPLLYFEANMWKKMEKDIRCGRTIGYILRGGEEDRVRQRERIPRHS